MERQKFEESLKKTFDQAEFTPSDKVWTNIELDLERLDRGDLKKRLTFFKLLAAASVIFALGVAGTGVYLLTADRSGNTGRTAERQDQTSSPSQRVAPQENDGLHVAPPNPSTTDTQTASDVADLKLDVPGKRPETSRPQGNAAAGDDVAENRAGVNPVDATATPPVSPSADVALAVAPSASDADVMDVAVARDEEDAREPLRMVPFSKDQLPPLVQQMKIVPHFPKTEPDQIDLLLASIEMEERASREKKKFDGEKVWTSVGFSAGTFSNPNPGGPTSVMNTMGSSVNFTSANTTLVNETQASGVSYSIGVNVGGKIAPRWVLQGGINYMTQNAAFTSDAVVTEDYQNFKAAYSAEITKMSDASARVVPTAPYTVTNNMEYLSIPLQAGYLLVNRSFGIQLNGGIATDLFIQNTLQPQSGSLDKVTNGRGSDSPYRPLNFSGLVGSEISYRFAGNYRISVNPGLRYPLSSIYKSDVGLSVTPVTFDVGLRFKYIFQ